MFYGESGDRQYRWASTSEKDSKYFSATLDGLRSSTTYYFHVADHLNATGGSSESRLLSFTTPNDGSADAIVFGDAISPRITRIGNALDRSRATLDVTTDESAQGVLEYGLTREFGTKATSEGLKHSFTLNGLADNTEYYAQLTLSDQEGNKSILQFLVKTLGVADQAKNIEMPTRPKPSVFISLKLDKMTITEGESTVMRWNAKDKKPDDPGVLTCTGGDAWIGPKRESGEERIGPHAEGTYTFHLRA